MRTGAEVLFPPARLLANDQVGSRLLSRLTVELTEIRRLRISFRPPMQFGPRTKTLFDDSRWRPSSTYPPHHQCYADELERLLEFSAAHKQLDRYASKLCSRERDSAIAELQVAYDLADRGFQFIEFEPLGLNGKRGEFLVTPAMQPAEVFTEVKAPDWHAEVMGFGKAAANPERLTVAKERLTRPKYRHLSGGGYLPGAGIEFAIEKAYEKLPNDRPTLLVVPSNGMFNSYEYTPQIVADRRLWNRGGPFDSTKFQRLGGLAFSGTNFVAPRSGMTWRSFRTRTRLQRTHFQRPP